LKDGAAFVCSSDVVKIILQAQFGAEWNSKIQIVEKLIFYQTHREHQKKIHIPQLLIAGYAPDERKFTESIFCPHDIKLLKPARTIASIAQILKAKGVAKLYFIYDQQLESEVIDYLKDKGFTEIFTLDELSRFLNSKVDLTEMIQSRQIGDQV